MSVEPDWAYRVREAFDHVADLAVAERVVYLSRLAGTDPILAREVEQLLDYDPGEDALREVVAGVAAEFRGAREIRGGTIGPYRLIEEIGHGGMGTVWLAERDDDAYRAQVAIKLLRGVTDPQLLARFRAERRILAKLEHPNIARLLDGGAASDGSPYVVMEYVRGRPIDAYCDAHRLDLEARLELFCTICSAVQYAHRNLIVHRDLKPTNILVDDEGVPKLLDFGIAKLLDTSDLEDALETGTGTNLLTPRYASPEQIRGDPISTATDVYSLGVLLHWLLTGDLPYRLGSTDPLELVRAVCEQDPIRPSVAVANALRREDREEVPRAARAARRLQGDLDNIVSKALRKEPRHRYGSPEELADDIRRHLARLPVVARPATLGYRLERFVSRHRWEVAAGGATAVLLIGAMLFSVTQMRAALEARESAVAQAVQATLSAASIRIETEAPVAAGAFLESVDEEERGWEWRHLRAQLDGTRLFAGALGAVGAGLTVDGRSVVTIAQSGLVEWRDLVDQTSVRSTSIPVTGIRHAAFSRDTRRVVVAAESSVSLWEVEQAPPTKLQEWSVGDEVTGLAASASGLDVVATTAASTWMWSEARPTGIGVPHGDARGSVGISADGGLAAVLDPSYDGSYRIVDADRPQLVEETVGRDVVVAAVSPDGSLAATGETDRVLRVREARSGRVIHRLRGHTGQPTVVAFGPRGLRLVSAASSDVRVWDVDAESPLAVFEGPADPKELRLSNDGSLLLVVARSGHVSVFRVPRPGDRGSWRAGAAAYAADGSSAWTITTDGVLRTLDHASGEWFDQVDLREERVTALASSADDRWIATLHDGVAAARDVSAPTEAHPLDTGSSPVVAIAFAPTEPRFGTLDAAGQVIVWDAEDWSVLVRMQGPAASEGSIAFSPDGSRLATQDAEGVTLWNVSGGTVAHRITDRDRTAASVAFGPDGDRVAVGWSDGSVGVYDGRGGGESRATGSQPSRVTALTFAPDGRRLAAGTHAGGVWILDPDRGSLLLELRGHDFRITSLAFSRDGETLLSADQGGLEGGTLRIWDSARPIDRLRAARRLEGAREAVQPMVTRLLAATSDARAVADSVRVNDALSPVERRAALQLALDPPLPATGLNRDPFDGFAFEATSLDSYVRIEPHASLRLTEAFTVEAWIQPLAPERGGGADPGMILNKEGEYQIARSASGELWWLVAGPQGWLEPWRHLRYRIPVGTWAHVALVRDDGVVRISVNGTQVQSVEVPDRPGDHHPGMDELRLLGRQHTPASMTGRIDEVRIWRVARTEAQIRETMLERVPGDEPGLVAAWSFDEGEGDVARDATGRHPGRLAGGAWTATRR